MNTGNCDIESVQVHFLPKLVSEEELSDGLVVMIDLLRASTTIIHALENEAKEIIPCETLEEAIAKREHFPGDSVLTGGERGGELIPGFDLDNSPFSYEKEIVRNKTIIFTTTNGTRALKHAQKAKRILIGSLVNLDAICREVLKSGGIVHFLCAGTNGLISSEDILCAGAMVNHLLSLDPNLTKEQLSDKSQIALGFFESIEESELENALRISRGGKNLIRLGMDRDIKRSCEFNRFSSVPEYFPESRTIQIPRKV